uniref:Uncharacterized protein n=1 Tax=Panagrolaimus superbus TaxID=310955 RepID=A0A914YNI6_9BILA
MSRFLGPIAGIAAGLGIAALLSSMGLGGAFLEMMSSLLLIGLVIFAVLFIVRRLRGSAARPAMQQAGGQSMMRNADPAPSPWKQPQAAPAPMPAAAPAAQPAAAAAVPAPPVDESWFIPDPVRGNPETVGQGRRGTTAYLPDRRPAQGSRSSNRSAPRRERDSSGTAQCRTAGYRKSSRRPPGQRALLRYAA